MKLNSCFLKAGTPLQTIFTADETGKINHNHGNNSSSPILQPTVHVPLFQTVWENSNFVNIRFCNSSCSTRNCSDDKCYKMRFAVLWAFILHMLMAVNKNETF